MLRLKSNCRTMLVDPRVLVEVISVTPAMRPNWRSSGAATDVAIVSGLAPGRDPETMMVGNSTCGRAATGSKRKATTPTRASAIVRSVVAIGLLMKGAEMFMPVRGRALPDSQVRNGVHRGVSPIDRTRGKRPGLYRGSASG